MGVPGPNPGEQFILLSSEHRLMRLQETCGTVRKILPAPRTGKPPGLTRDNPTHSGCGTMHYASTSLPDSL